MKALMSVVAAAAALAAGFSLMSVHDADADCRMGYGCEAAVLVPVPQPIPLRRWRRPRVVAVAPCIEPCAAPVAAAPVAPCVAPCGVPAPRAYYYRSSNYFAYYKQPAYARSCNLGPGNCFWRLDCWYDSFGRRFCN